MILTFTKKRHPSDCNYEIIEWTGFLQDVDKIDNKCKFTDAIATFTNKSYPFNFNYQIIAWIVGFMQDVDSADNKCKFTSQISMYISSILYPQNALTRILVKKEKARCEP